MGNSSCQKANNLDHELLVSLSPREVCRPMLLQAKKILEATDDNASRSRPRLSFDSKAFQMDMRRKAESRSKSPLNSHSNSIANAEPPVVQSLKKKPQKNRREMSIGSSLALKKSLKMGSSGGNQSKIDAFLQKQIDFVQKRNKSIEKLRQQRDIERNKENKSRPDISENSKKIVEKKYGMLRAMKKVHFKDSDFNIHKNLYGDNHEHNRHVSVLSQKTIIQLEVNLGTETHVLKFEAGDDVDEVARAFVDKYGLMGQAHSYMANLIKEAINSN